MTRNNLSAFFGPMSTKWSSLMDSQHSLVQKFREEKEGNSWDLKA